MSDAGYRVRRAVDAAMLGPQRRRRVMHRQLRQLDGTHGPLRARYRAWRSARLSLIVLVVLTAGAAVTAQTGWLRPRVTQPVLGSAPPAGFDAQSRPVVGAPTHAFLVDPHRLLPKPVAPSASTAYRNLHEAGGRPIRWEPCRPIHYVVHHGGEPRLYDRLLRLAIGQVSRATGLRFVADGSTVELPLYKPADRLLYQPDLYGDRWAPVLVAWSNTAQSPQLAGRVEGMAGPQGFGTPTTTRWVSGNVVFDVDKLELMRHRPHYAQWVEAVLLHELGHLVGLGHVHDRTQVMYPVNVRPATHYGAGDLAGLAVLGAGPCYSDY
jgi:hypothetical protein